MSIFDDLPPCPCPPDAVEHDIDCIRGFELDRRTEGMTDEERLAAVRAGAGLSPWER